MRAALLIVLTACGVDLGALPVKGGEAGGLASANGGGGFGGGFGGGSGTGGGTTAPITDESWTGGSRLKARVVSDGAGGVSSLGWTDSQLGVPCLFSTAADGQLRCLPWLTTAYASDTVFTNASCTQPGVISYGCAPSHATRSQTDVCPSRTRLFSIGAVVSQTTYFSKSGTQCSMQTVGNGGTVYALGSELAASSFVSVTMTKGSGTGVQLNRISASDGASGTFDLRDVGSAFDCWETTFSDGSRRCPPSAVVYYGYDYADSSCSTPAYAVSGPCPAAQYTEKWGTGGGACEIEPQYGRLGSPLSTSYRGSCDAVQSSSSRQVYGAGQALPPSSFAAGTPSITSLGRLERRVLTWPGGTRTLSGWRDTQLDAECYTYYSASDGSRRCVPWTPGVQTSAAWFSDAACTQQLASAQRDCAPKFAVDFSDSCRQRARSFNVGARYSGTVWTRDGNGACVTTGTPSGSLFRLTGEVLPSSMAALTEELR